MIRYTPPIILFLEDDKQVINLVWPIYYNSNVLWHFNFTTKFQFTKTVRVGDVFRHDSSCSAQTKFSINSTGGYAYTWLCVHKCFINNVKLL